MDRVHEEAGLGAVFTYGVLRFRVWAPSARNVTVVLENGERTLEAEGNGYFSATVTDVGPGALYRYRLDERGPYPDPCSRFQPQGPHGPSMVVDRNAFAWSDSAWPGVEMKGQ